jgi:hypothetical protein
MRRLPYARRVARVLDGTSLLVPVRPVWGQAEEVRIPQRDVAAAVTPAAASSGGDAPGRVARAAFTPAPASEDVGSNDAVSPQSLREQPETPQPSSPANPAQSFPPAPMTERESPDHLPAAATPAHEDDEHPATIEAGARTGVPVLAAGRRRSGEAPALQGESKDRDAAAMRLDPSRPAYREESPAPADSPAAVPPANRGNAPQDRPGRPVAAERRRSGRADIETAASSGWITPPERPEGNEAHARATAPATSPQGMTRSAGVALSREAAAAEMPAEREATPGGRHSPSTPEPRDGRHRAASAEPREGRHRAASGEPRNEPHLVATPEPRPTIAERGPTAELRPADPIAPSRAAGTPRGEPIVLSPPGRRAPAPPPPGTNTPAAIAPAFIPSEPSLKIGTIEVHIDAPPAAAARPSASAPLARGFASTLGLRQG